MANEATTYLVTGATRGIGRAVVELLSSSGGADVRVIAAVRDAKNDAAVALATALPNVIVVEIDCLRDESALEAATQLHAQGLRTVDVVLANAGVHVTPARAIDTTAAMLRTMLDVHAVAPMLLLSAFVPFLRRAKHPRFIVTSSLGGTMEMQDDIFAAYEESDEGPKATSYAISKAAANMLVKRVALEEQWLTAVAMHPGLVATDSLALGIGKEQVDGLLDEGIILTPQQSAAAIVLLINTAQHETHSGRLFDVQANDFVG